MTEAFRHTERNRNLVFGPGAVDAARNLLPDHYTLVTTPRAAAGQHALANGADAVIHVPQGAVNALAADLRGQARGLPLVALGGGRVIDTAKAIAAAEGIDDVIAIPTSLSGAEMTGVHRHARGVADDVPRVRASVVINDPALSASLPPNQLAAGASNALAHAVTARLSVLSSPIARAVSVDAIRRLGEAWSAAEPDRDALALGALLAGWSVDRSGLGPHHALSQTAVRLASLQHADVNAALLPQTLKAFRTRAPRALAAIDRDLGKPLEDLADQLRTRAGVAGLGELGSDASLLERTVDAAAGRGELKRIPPLMDADEVRDIYVAAAGSTL